MHNTTRRTFLGAGAAAAAGAQLTFGQEQESTTGPADSWLMAEYDKRYPALLVRSGLQVKTVETFCSGDTVCVVKVTADDGSIGYGQTAPYDADVTTQVLHRRVARHILGRDPYDVSRFVDACIDANLKFPWSYVCRGLAGVETALWDLRGRRENKAVAELLGGETRPLPVYGSSMRRDISPSDEAARLKKLRDELGYRAFKIRVGTPAGRDRDAASGRSEEIVPLMRDRLGDEIDLLADANSCYLPEAAIAIGRLMQDANFFHFEEPCPYWELEWTAQVADALELPIAGGEQDNDLAQWRRMVRMRSVDIVQPDVCYLGGLTRALRVASLAEDHGLVCTPHAANRSYVALFTMHLLGSIAVGGRYMEYSIEDAAWSDAIFDPPLSVVDGAVPFPDAPGWGVEPRQAWLEQAERRVSEEEG